jgi:carboxyl-terminal processing protease
MRFDNRFGGKGGQGSKLLVFVVAACVLGGFLGFACSAQAFSGSGEQELKTTISNQELLRLSTVVAEIKKYYVKPVGDQELFDNAISGMLYGLDPHSEYLRKDDLESLATFTMGKFGGIGIEIVPYQGLLKIISPLDDSPAAKAGIKAGDIIAQIDGKLVKDMTSSEAVRVMRGVKGSKVKLTIVRLDNPRPLVFNLIRDIVKLQSVKTKMLEPGYAYVRIASFQESTQIDLLRAIKKLKRGSDDGLKGMILDLRNNPGGLLESAIQISDDFLDKDKLKGRKDNDIIVYTKGNSESSRFVANANSGELLPNVSIVVLINEGSASAAEVLAGALQDHRRALIVGKRSFGKGSVQTLLPVSNDSAIKLTTALYYTPLGRSIQAKGIDPDIVLDDFAVNKAKNSLGMDSDLNEKSFSGYLKNDKDEKAKVDSDAGAVRGDDGDGDESDTGGDEKNGQDGEVLGIKGVNGGLKLAREDYQLYEALKIVKGLAVFHVKG